jgi:hypothetical protein
MPMGGTKALNTLVPDSLTPSSEILLRSASSITYMSHSQRLRFFFLTPISAIKVSLSETLWICKSLIRHPKKPPASPKSPTPFERELKEYIYIPCYYVCP